MDLLELALELVKEAGAAVLKHRGSEYTLKADGTFYTKGDEVSHSILLGLEQSCIPVLSEEMDAEAYSAIQEIYQSEKKVWIVDPLDGTKDYAKGNDEFAISAALIEEGKPIIGVVSAPARNLVIYAKKGCGTTVINNGSGSSMRTSSVNDFEKMRLLVSASELNPEAFPDYVNNLARLGYKDNDDRIQAMGSTALKTSLVAMGLGDYQFTFTAWDLVREKMRITKEWDNAASYLLVTEAGGMMTDCLGNDFVFGKEDPMNYNGVFTSNSRENHQTLLEYVIGNVDLEEIIKPK